MTKLEGQDIFDRLGQITALAHRQLQLAEAVEGAEEALKIAKERLRVCQEVDLPLAMAEADVSDVVLADGYRLISKPEVYASIPDEQKPAAFAWLDRHGFSDIIKNEIKVAFGRGQDAAALDIYNTLDEQGFHPSMAKSIHYQTLRAFVKERLAALDVVGDAALPLDVFGVTQVTKVTIKPPKK